MREVRRKIVELLMRGFCAPSIQRIAKELGVPASTVHYNIKKMEEEGIIKTYKAVFDYSKIDMGFCAYVLIRLSPEEYNNPERIASELAKYPQIESVDIITGDWEIIIKVRVKDQDEYYEFVKKVLSRPGIVRIKSLISLKQLKTEFIKNF